MNATLAPTTEFYNGLVNLWGGPEMTDFYGESQPEERHRECFDALAAVLVKFGKANAFEVYLTHRHYVLEPGEVLVSRFEEASKDWLLVAELAQAGLVPVTFCFDESGAPIETVYVEPGVIAELDESDLACMLELGAVIVAAGLQEILGVSRVFRELGAEDLQRYREGADPVVDRCQRSVPVDSYGSDTGGIHTHWRLVNKKEWLVAGNCFGLNH